MNALVLGYGVSYAPTAYAGLLRRTVGYRICHVKLVNLHLRA